MMFPVSRTNLMKYLKKWSETAKRAARNRISSLREAMSKNTSTTSTDDTPVKPPNILVHHGDGAEQGRLRQLVTSVVGAAHYTVYDLPLAAPPVWMENAVLLVVAGELSGEAAGAAEEFVSAGGSVVSLASSLTLGVLADPEPAPQGTVRVTHGEQAEVPCQFGPTARRLRETLPPGCAVTEPATVLPPGDAAPVVLRCEPSGGGAALLCQLRWDAAAPQQRALLRSLLRAELGLRCAAEEAEVQYRPGHLVFNVGDPKIHTDEVIKRLRNVPPPPGASPELRLTFTADAEPPAASAELLPVYPHPAARELFDTALFWRHLATERLGRVFLFFPAVTSSMDVVRDSRLPSGAAVVCDVQTRGRGRAGNTWLSPPGCCMLALRLEVALDSTIGRKLSWLQHALALALVMAVGDKRLRIKWPNDLYWEGRQKVGGVLVEVDVTGASAICRLGAAINLDNAAPTVCLNSLLQEPVRREVLLGRAITELEILLLRRRWADLSATYRRHWLHEEQRVTVWREGAPRQATVAGLDHHGFLKVRGDDGEEMTVSPDGNSFDMMKGLIVPKVTAK